VQYIDIFGSFPHIKFGYR